MTRHNNRLAKLTNANKTEHVNPLGEIKGKKKDPLVPSSCSVGLTPSNELQKCTENKTNKKKKKNSSEKGQDGNNPNADMLGSHPSDNNEDGSGEAAGEAEHDGTGDDPVVGSQKGEETADQTLSPNDLVPIISLHKETILNYKEREDVPHKKETLLRGSNCGGKLRVVHGQGNHASRSLDGRTSLRSKARTKPRSDRSRLGSIEGDEVAVPHSATKKVLFEGGVKIVKSELREVGAGNESDAAPEGGELNEAKPCESDSPDEPSARSSDKLDKAELIKGEPPPPQYEKYKRKKKKKKKKIIKFELFKKSVLYSNYTGPDILNALNQTKLNLSFYQREVDDFLSVIRNLQNIVMIEREKYMELKEMLKYTTEEIEKENARLYEEIHSYKKKYNQLRTVISNIGYGIFFNLHKREVPTCTNNDNINLEGGYGEEGREEYTAEVNEYDYVMVNETVCSGNGGNAKGKHTRRGKSGNTSSLLKYLDF
ncbi:hypothetical protein AK88_01387 [Plasmodium fragile]|uniref:Uncharacterized protein n=1 Tax=Plasmodium fragile TaxID=5857 RepID=A0A0D9QPN4_PLAFR|nr:uncharacterized protein AK88_01387 [Plasmodium fragile]KJP88893.1 hypothetical protein AK88_01387 [Plasmodium fragile]